ncbi:hypothetical protein SAMN05421753_1332 [Planctomicrobium piriforme]|uniref:Uncharacterized protein n=1 Tax=Planctomicrobium piriforme TaxID=1576369 RepID=A0A1I3TL76_9PLAN|nr:hypothetical protein SAMN05421753_1332 [Planctomicrobium piriforme]
MNADLDRKVPIAALVHALRAVRNRWTVRSVTANVNFVQNADQALPLVEIRLAHAMEIVPSHALPSIVKAATATVPARPLRAKAARKIVLKK